MVININICQKKLCYMVKEKTMNFLNRLFNLLEETKETDIIEWNEEGNGFLVYDSQRLSDQILPKYFKHHKITSFIRQLNMYSFHKVYKNNCEFAYSHKFFLKAQTKSLKKIKRKKESNRFCNNIQQDISSEECQQYVSLQKKQNQLEKACLNSIRKTKIFLAQAKQNEQIIFEDQRKSRSQYLEKISQLFQALGMNLDELKIAELHQSLKFSQPDSEQLKTLIRQSAKTENYKAYQINKQGKVQLKINNNNDNNASSDFREIFLESHYNAIYPMESRFCK